LECRLGFGRGIGFGVGVELFDGELTGRVRRTELADGENDPAEHRIAVGGPVATERAGNGQGHSAPAHSRSVTHRIDGRGRVDGWEILPVDTDRGQGREGQSDVWIDRSDTNLHCIDRDAR
jgi:hypothetical protein